MVNLTEIGVISVGVKLPKHLWVRNFTVEQFGDQLQVHILVYQDNKGTSILLENSNNISSYGKGSKPNTYI